MASFRLTARLLYPRVLATRTVVSLAGFGDVNGLCCVLLLGRLTDNALKSYASAKRQREKKTNQENAKRFHRSTIMPTVTHVN
jgi:hypothetical protein